MGLFYSSLTPKIPGQMIQNIDILVDLTYIHEDFDNFQIDCIIAFAGRTKQRVCNITLQNYNPNAWGNSLRQLLCHLS